MPAIILTEEQATQLVAVLREATRTTYLDALATLDDCDAIVNLTARVAQQVEQV